MVQYKLNTGNPHAQVERSKIDPLWQAEDYFYSFTKDSGAGKVVAFVVIDTNLLFYGYEGEYDPKNIMKNHFAKLGWVPGSKTIESQLAWIDSELEKYKSADYLVVAGKSCLAKGHHPSAVCSPAGDMQKVADLLVKHRVSAYLYGHKHALSFASVDDVAYVQSGNAAITDKPCKEDGVKFYGGKGTFGFVRAIVHKRKGLEFEYRDLDNKLLYSSPKIAPRL